MKLFNIMYKVVVIVVPNAVFYKFQELITTIIIKPSPFI